MATEIPSGSGYPAPPATITPDSLMDQIRGTVPGFVAGMIKGNTIDFLGLPVDLINQTLGAVGLKSGKPVGGADSIREMLGVKPTEQDTAAEIGGSFISPAGLSKAMIVGAARVLRQEGKSSVSIANIVNSAQTAEVTAMNQSKADIFQKTGAFADRVLDIKSIISDSKASFKSPDVLGVGNYNNKAVLYANPKKVNTLSDLLQHDELFALYPELKDYKVRNMDAPIGEAAFTRSTKVIEFGPMASVKQFMERTLHEVQHAIQNIEDFRPGTNPNFEREFKAVELTDARKQNLKDLAAQGNEHATKILDMINTDIRAANLKYKNNAGEVEARFTEQNKDLSKDQLTSKIYDLISTNTPESLWAK